MIEFRNVTKEYRTGETHFKALKGISFSIDKGELVAIVGTSGSGKTTTMNIMGLLDRPSTGEYFLNGRNVSELSANERADLRNRTIGFVFQLFFLLPRLNALQNVSLPLTYRNLSASKIKQSAFEMLKKIGVESLYKHKPSEMSGGQQQRVAIARALVGKPDIILADEPTGALDSKTSQEVLDLLAKLNREEGCTVVIITHDVNVAAQCSRVIKIHDGLIEP